MLNNLIRKYNRNRREIWIVVVIIAFIIGFRYALTSYMKNDRIGSNNNATTYFPNNNQNDYPILNNKIYEDKNVSKNSEEISNTIKTFIQHCNNKEIEKAYNMLSEDIKHNLYKNKTEFVKNYYIIFFKTKKIYNMQAWITSGGYYTYKVEFEEDLLSTGGADSNKIEEYYTVVKENEKYKININRYIGNIEINKITEKNNVKITVLSKNIYLDNIEYKIKVENLSNNTIVLDTKNTKRTTALMDSNNFAYPAYMYKLLENDLTVYSGETKEINIQFNQQYNAKYYNTKIVFNNFNLDNNSNKKTIFEVDV